MKSGIVECSRLDDFVESQTIFRVYLIKVDAEGHDLEFIRGANRTLIGGNPILMVEALDVLDLNSIIDVLADNTEVYRIVNKYPFSAINNFTETNNYIALNSSKLKTIPDFLITQGFLKLLD